MTDPNLIRINATLDREWAEGVDWYQAHEWTPELTNRFTTLLSMDMEEFRRSATTHELDAVQRLAWLAFYEIAKRALERKEAEA